MSNPTYIIEELSYRGWKAITGNCHLELIQEYYNTLRKRNTLKDYRLVEIKTVQSEERKVIPLATNA